MRPGRRLSPFVGQQLTTFISTEHHSLIERLATFLESGAVAPVVSARFPLEGAIDAVRRMERGDTSGKTAIVVTDDQNL